MTSRHHALGRIRHAYELAFEPGTGRIALAADVQIHPERDAVVFAGTVVDDLDEDGRSLLCLADATGIRPLFPDLASQQHHGRWSPDGSSIAFLSDTDGNSIPRLLVADPSGASIITTPAIPAVIEAVHWSPDGRAILLVAADPDADLADLPGPGSLAGTASWQPLIRGTGQRRRRLWIHNLVNGSTSPVELPALNVWEASWCGADSVAVVGSVGAGEGSWFHSELYWIPMDSTSGTRLWTPQDQLARPVGDPSGRRVAVVHGIASDRGNLAGDVVVHDIASRAHRRVDTVGVDVTDLTWTDATHLRFIGLRRLTTVAGVITVGDMDTCEITWEDDGSCGRHIPTATFQTSGAMAVIRDSFVDYPAVLLVHEDDTVETHSLASPGTDELAKIGTAEPVHWQSPDGRALDGVLCRPNTDGPHPLILHVHGGPVGTTTNAWHMQNDTTRHLVAAGFAVLHPNPRGSVGRGQEFIRQVLGDMGGADTQDLLSAVDAMVEQGVADPERIGVAGTSYGGYMANWLPTQSPRFRAAVAMSPVTDWHSLYYTSNIPEFVALFLGGGPDDCPSAYRDRSPVTFADGVTTPTLETAGARDLCTPAEQAIRFHNALAMRAVKTQLVLYPEEGHGMRRISATIDLCTRVLEWFETHLAADDTTGSV